MRIGAVQLQQVSIFLTKKTKKIKAVPSFYQYIGELSGRRFARNSSNIESASSAGKSAVGVMII
jgi:hypothetical protein